VDLCSVDREAGGCVEALSHAAEELQDEGYAVDGVELDAGEFDCMLEERVGLGVGVDLDEGGQNDEEAVGGEDVVEVSGGVDVYAEAGAYHVEVVWVKNKGAVDDVEKGSEVPGGGGLGVHAGEERPDKLAPGVLVEHVGG